MKIHSISITKSANIERFTAEPYNKGWYCPYCGEKLEPLSGHFHETSSPTITGIIETYEKLPDDLVSFMDFILDDKIKFIFSPFRITSSNLDPLELDKKHKIVSEYPRNSKTYIYEFMAGKHTEEFIGDFA